MSAHEQLQYAKERFKSLKIVRKAAAPYMNKKLELMDAKYYLSDDAEFLRSLNNVHEGERCFIVGNGPSLRADDLDMLINEFTFAANSIYRMYEQTDWRPTYYVCVDRSSISLELDAIIKANQGIMFIDLFARKRVADKPRNLVFINQHLTYFDQQKYVTGNVSFSEDVSRYVCAGYTVTYAMIQLAAYMGFKKIYLLGIDHTYGRSVNSSGKITNVRSGEDHFYSEKGMRGYYYYEGVEYAYDLAKRRGQSAGFQIINATRSSALEIFPRICFDSLFNH